MTGILAVYGAVAATIAAVAAIWNVYRDRSRLRIEVAAARLSLSQQIDLKALQTTITDWLDCVSVSVSNVGRRPMTIGQCIVNCDDGRSLVFAPGAFLRYGQAGLTIDNSHKTPKRLEEGESHVYYFPVDSLKESLERDGTSELTLVSIEDGTGKTWRARMAPSVARVIHGDRTGGN